MTTALLFEKLHRLVETDRSWTHVDSIVVGGGDGHVRCWPDGTIDRHVDSYSLTKPILTTLVGCALDDGFLSGIESRVAGILSGASEHHPSLTVRHLVTMTAAIVGDGFTDVDRVMRLGSSWIDAILALPAERPHGKAFKYDNRTAHLTAAVLQKVLPLPLLEYAETRLLRPLGISRWTWPTDPEGIPYGFGHLRLSPFDLSTIGRLWLAPDQGRTTGVLTEGFRTSAWTPSSDGGAPEHRPYGYTWWCDVEAEPPAWFAAGYAGQLLAVLPSWATVVVITGSEARLKGDESPSYELLRRALLEAG